MAHVRKIYSQGAWRGKDPSNSGIYPKNHLCLRLELQFICKYVSSSIAFDWHWINKMWEVINKFIKWAQYLAKDWTSVVWFLNKEKESVEAAQNFPDAEIFQADRVTVDTKASEFS